MEFDDGEGGHGGISWWRRGHGGSRENLRCRKGDTMSFRDTLVAKGKNNLRNVIGFRS